MLSIKTDKGFLPLENRKNFNIKTEYGGNQVMSFDIPTKDSKYKYIHERSVLKYGDNEFLVESINQRKMTTSITAVINMDDWKKEFHHNWDSTYDLFSDVLLAIKPKEWTIDDMGTVSGRKAMHLEGVTDYDILMNCKSLYNIAYEFHTSEKRIKILKPDTYQSRGLYATDELNASNIEYKGDTKNFATRLYAFGKKTVETDEEGNVISTSYVTFAGINGGKPYVEDFTYSNNIITAYWTDERYTVAEDLLTDATEKLKTLAKPASSYGFELIDLSRVDEKYKYLDFHMYDKVSLIINGDKIEHQIVEYTEYPDDQNRNKVVLSTAFKKITGTIENMNQQIDNIDIDLSVKENMINELRRDAKSNSMRIENTYTKGDVDIIKESILQQTSESIDASIKEVDKKIEQIDIKAIQLQMVKEGTLLSQEVSSIVLQAQVSENAQDITDSIPNISFTWQRKSKDVTADAAWNEAHKHLKSVTITHEDVFQSASFQVSVTTASYTKVSGYETITDETDIPKLSLYLYSNLSEYQHYDAKSNTYNPSWNPLVITPEVFDGVMQVQLSACEIIWRRSDGALQEGEEVVDGALKVSQNKLSESTDKVITYLCSVRYKEYQVMAQKSYALIIDGVDGTNGKDGVDGKDGVKGDTGATGNGIASVVAEYYLSTSKTTQAGGSWVTTAPTWSSGKYMWTRTKVTYTSGTINYTAPVCDSSWEAANEVEDKVNEKIKNDVGDVETRVTETFNSSLDITKKEITSSVEEIKKTATDALEMIESVETSVKQNSVGVTILTKAKEELTELLNGNIKDVSELKKWVEIGDGSIKIGRSDNDFSMTLDNTKLAFLQNKVEIAWISNNELHIAHAVVMETIKIGSFQFDYQPNVGLVLKKWK